jgi:hypothetical protein
MIINDLLTLPYSMGGQLGATETIAEHRDPSLAVVMPVRRHTGAALVCSPHDLGLVIVATRCVHELSYAWHVWCLHTGDWNEAHK